ncbi:DUF6300 family protein [Streptomyces sp. NPDC058305]|uniref:DUF6300 family protein n=1 Tax=Streptomyces sp. NPDC058305 TaxID=3346438 RepID=UPI0036E60F62
MELCTTCDAHRPAARAVIDWYADEDPRSRGCAQLFDAWETETMHAHGWARSPQPETAPGARSSMLLHATRTRGPARAPRRAGRAHRPRRTAARATRSGPVAPTSPADPTAAGPRPARCAARTPAASALRGAAPAARRAPPRPAARVSPPARRPSPCARQLGPPGPKAVRCRPAVLPVRGLPGSCPGSSSPIPPRV